MTGFCGKEVLLVSDTWVIGPDTGKGVDMKKINEEMQKELEEYEKGGERMTIWDIIKTDLTGKPVDGRKIRRYSIRRTSFFFELPEDLSEVYEYYGTSYMDVINQFSTYLLLMKNRRVCMTEYLLKDDAWFVGAYAIDEGNITKLHFSEFYRYTVKMEE